MNALLRIPSLDELRARHGARYKWIALSTVMIGAIASLLNSTIVNVAVPQLVEDFGIGLERVQWVSSSHMAATTVSMLAMPWLLARFGFRILFFVAMVLLFAGSVGGALAPGFPFLIGMRVLQGVAAGLLQPLATVLILRAFPADEQGRASGLYGFGVVLAPALGPSVGGLLTDLMGWRAVFLVSPPFALLAMLMAHRLLPRMSLPPDERPFDLPGMLGVALFVPLLLMAFVDLHDHGWTPITFAAFGAAGVVLLAFLWRQRRAAAPLVDFRVLRCHDFRAGLVVAFIYGMGLFGSTLLVPMFVQQARHFTATQSGTLLLPAGIALALAIPVSGRLADRFAPRPLVVGGLLLFGLSFALLALWPAAGFAALAAMLVLGRVGLGLILPALTLGSVRRVAAPLLGQAASLFNFTRMLGGAVGTSAVTIFVESRARTLAAAPDGLLRAFHDGFWVLAALFGVAAVAAWGLRGEVDAARQVAPRA